MLPARVQRHETRDGQAADAHPHTRTPPRRVLQLKLSPGGARARVSCVIQPRTPGGAVALRAPTALAFRGGLLWVVNARMLDCPFVLPCKGTAYEIVGIDPADVC